MPFLNNWSQTEQAIRDCLAQTDLPSPPQVLAIDNGAPTELREALDRWATKEPRLHAWHHRPSLPSLSATWNAALDFVWGQGGEVALVANNDVRLAPNTYYELASIFGHTKALFASAVGRREGDFDLSERHQVQYTAPGDDGWGDVINKGGPDFSCFVISRECHEAYPFDERFTPAYCEDCDYHRRTMLGGDGSRIFSVNLPYLHYASGTINSEPEKALAWAKRIEQSRAHYVRKWGGDVNHERFTIPFDAETDQDHVTNPELQALILGGSHAPIPESVAGDAVLGEGVDRAAP
jgi:hypothetical protein